ncbi:MAG: hypothetical protein R3F26_09290 [Gammaproteobacteria bacterium]
MIIKLRSRVRALLLAALNETVAPYPTYAMPEISGIPARQNKPLNLNIIKIQPKYDSFELLSRSQNTRHPD